MVSRSSSFIGTIKSILPSKLPWFGSGNNQADAASKRKQAAERSTVEEDTRGVKRQRVDDRSSGGRKILEEGQLLMPTSEFGYLDPPKHTFEGTSRVEVPRASPLQARASSVAAPSRHRREGSKSRLAFSPSVGGRVGQINRVARTQSMDPPSRHGLPSYRPVLSPVAMTRDVSMEDTTLRESPDTPSKPFRMRTSLTPQLQDQAFGPIPVRRERDATEPPPLASLIERPVFVRAPPEGARQASPTVPSAPLTLGAVAHAQRTVFALCSSVYARDLPFLFRSNHCSDRIAR